MKLVLLLFLLIFILPAASWWSRRRRSCSAVNCAVNSWSEWNECNCKSELRYRKRSKSRSESCGGGCSYRFSESKSCCCTINCELSQWGSWGPCSRTCGASNTGIRHRYRAITRKPYCGGVSCSDTTDWQYCSSGCCPVNCRVSGWTPWTTECPCGTTARQTRYRTILENSACGGSSCPGLTESRDKLCSCCPEDCEWKWSEWEPCSKTCGQGNQRRTISVTKYAACGGRLCPNTSVTEDQVCAVREEKHCCSNGCINGKCTLSTNSSLEYKCICDAGWSGVKCSDAICRRFACVNGNCIHPDVCVCLPGWRGISCDIAICSRGCGRGKCINPEQCSCPTGWTGATCDTPICENGCENNGDCIAPNRCRCPVAQWTGKNCSKPVCLNNCYNGGTCVAPSTCNCSDGYSGSQCEITSCKDIAAPTNGLVSCMTFNQQRVCNVYCKDGFDFSIMPNNPLLCGVNGIWSHEQRNEPIPECLKPDPLGLYVVFKAQFNYPGDCSQLTDQERAKVSGLAFAAIKSRLCPCNKFLITGESIECGKIAKRGADVLETNLVFTFKIEANDSEGLLNKKYCDASCRSASQLFASIVTSAGQKLKENLANDSLSIQVNGTTFSYTPDSATVGKPKATCNKIGQMRIGTRCISCAKGSYFDNEKCNLCPFNMYQDAEAQTVCKPCPFQSVTVGKGSRSADDCLKRCQPGSYGQNGVEPCTKCPLDSFQTEVGQSSCVPCPNGTVTKREGETSEASCILGKCYEMGCEHGFLCSDCRCIADYKRCDYIYDCSDGSDEKDCNLCQGFFCLSDFLRFGRLCLSFFAVAMKVVKITEIEGDRRMVEGQVEEVLLGGNVSSVYDGRYVLGSKAVACHCPQININQDYLLTGYENQNGTPVIGHDSIVKPLRQDTKAEMLTALEQVKAGSCPYTYGWDEESQNESST